MSTGWMHVYAALGRINTREFLRDRLSAFFSFLFPLMFVVIFGVTQARETSATFKLAVVDRSNDAAAAQLLDRLAARPGLELLPAGASASNDALQSGDVLGLLVVGPAPIASGNGLQLLVADPEGAPASFFRAALDVALAENAAAGSGTAYRVAKPADQPLNQFTFVLPGLLAMALLQLGLFSTATPLINARERGTFRHLATTPMPRSALFAAQLTLRFVTAGLQIALVLGVGMAFFDLHVAGSWFALLGLGALGAVMFIAVGYALAGLAPSQESGLAIVMLVNFAMLFLGQIFFDFASITWLDRISLVLPVTYLADAFRHIVTGAASRQPLWVDSLVLAAWAVAAGVIAIRTFRLDRRHA